MIRQLFQLPTHNTTVYFALLSNGLVEAFGVPCDTLKRWKEAFAYREVGALYPCAIDGVNTLLYCLPMGQAMGSLDGDWFDGLTNERVRRKSHMVTPINIGEMGIGDGTYVFLKQSIHLDSYLAIDHWGCIQVLSKEYMRGEGYTHTLNYGVPHQLTHTKPVAIFSTSIRNFMIDNEGAMYSTLVHLRDLHRHSDPWELLRYYGSVVMCYEFLDGIIALNRSGYLSADTRYNLCRGEYVPEYLFKCDS